MLKQNGSLKIVLVLIALAFGFAARADELKNRMDQLISQLAAIPVTDTTARLNLALTNKSLLLEALHSEDHFNLSFPRVAGLGDALLPDPASADKLASRSIDTVMVESLYGLDLKKTKAVLRLLEDVTTSHALDVLLQAFIEARDNRWTTDADRIRLHLQQRFTNSLTFFMKALDRSTPELKGMFYAPFFQRRDVELIPYIIKSAESPTPLDRMSAIERLAKYSHPIAIEQLRKLAIHDVDEQVRARAQAKVNALESRARACKSI